MPTNQVDQVVDLLVDEVLDGRSVQPRPPDGDADQRAGRAAPRGRRQRSTPQAGADLFTSSKVLAAEQRLVDAAGRHDGYAVDGVAAVDLALLESAANGVTLNAGQATLVREMATSGARLQLAIAPAGSGKTTAMRALASAWSDGGGTVIGLAPSAARPRTPCAHQIDTTACDRHPGQAHPPPRAGPADRCRDARLGRRHRLRARSW